MGTTRIPDRTGFARRNQVGTCRWCGGAVQPPRRTFCSDECVHQHKIRTQPGYAADLVVQRDGGVCQICGINCMLIRERLTQLLAAERRAAVASAGRHECTIAKWNVLRGDPVPRGCLHPECLDTAVRNLRRYWDLSPPPYSDRYKAACCEVGLPPKLWSMKRRLWEMDHIQPVVEGGGDCGLENLRTLCWDCHRIETAALAARRAKARRG